MFHPCLKNIHFHLSYSGMKQKGISRVHLWMMKSIHFHQCLQVNYSYVKQKRIIGKRNGSSCFTITYFQWFQRFTLVLWVNWVVMNSQNSNLFPILYTLVQLIQRYDLKFFCKGAVLAMGEKQRKIKPYIWNNQTDLDETWNGIQFLELITSSKAVSI